MPEPNREKEIFEQALDIESLEARAAFIRQACGGDEALIGRIESLLKASETAPAFLPEEPQRPSGAGLGGLAVEGPGTVIGRYKLLEQIGEGGFGYVYMADQLEPVKRRVALKIIKPGMDSKQVIGRFEAERQALALMDDPNIARVFDAGASETGRPYFVMELVKGIPITKFCEEQGLDLEARLKLFIQVCSAVQHAHQKGIIHRDLKPSNILVTLHGEEPVPKVIDFGIAKATQQPLTDKTVFTQFQQFLGTPAYMSPEQATLSGLDVDTRSDIYSLGVLLYELLTGSPPFDTKELLSAGLDEMRRIIRERAPDRPSTRIRKTAGSTRLPAGPQPVPSPVGSESEAHADKSGRRQAFDDGVERATRWRMRSPIPSDLDWIVMKCLEKERTRRYETANGLAADLRRHLDDEPVLARPPSRLYEFQKTVQRHKLGFAATALIILVLAAAVLVSTWQAARARRAERAQIRLREQAQADENRAQTEAAKSRQFAQFLQDMLKGVGPSVALGRDTTMLREILDKTAERVGRELTNQPDVEIEMRLTLADTYDELGLYQQEEQMAQESLRLARSMSRRSDDERLARSLESAERALYRLGNYAEAETLAREDLAMQKQRLGNEDPAVADALGNLAHVLRGEGKLTDAEPLLREALAMQRKLVGNVNHEVVVMLYTLANVLAQRGKLAEAEDLSRESLAIEKQLRGNENPGVAYALNNLGFVLQMRGKLTEAEAMFREALAIEKKLLGNDHPVVTTDLKNLANALLRQGKWPEAADCYADLIQREPTNHYYYHCLAPLLVKSGDLEEYRSCCKEILARFGDTTDPFVASRMATDCSILPSSGVAPEGVSRMAEVAAATGPTNRGYAWFQCTEGLVEYRQGHFAGAVSFADRSITAIGMHPGSYSVSDSLYVSACAVSAMARFQLKQIQAAGAVLAEANRVAASLPKLKYGYLGGDWLDWTIAHELLEEAAKLIPVAAVTNTDLSDPIVASLVFRPRDFLDRRLAHWDPQDSIGSMQLAFALAWAGPTNEYEAFCRKVLLQAASTTNASPERAAKAYLVRGSNPELLKQAVALAERAWARGKDGDSRLWFQMCLGLARYREKDYAGTLKLLAQPVNAVESWIRGPSLMLQAMALEESGRVEEAQSSFQAGVLLMDPPPPAGELTMDVLSNHDGVFFWLLHAEAEALIEGTSANP